MIDSARFGLGSGLVVDVYKGNGLSCVSLFWAGQREWAHGQ